MDFNTEYNLNLPGQKRVVIDGRISKRAIAFIIDLIIIHLLFLGPLIDLFPSSLSLSSLSEVSFGFSIFFSSALGCILLLYFSLFEHFLGATPGMRLLGLQTYTLSFSQAVVRNVFVIPVFPFYLLWIVELYYLIKYKQRFLERATQTKTLEVMTYSTQ
ncbi:MAG: RDD family protein [Nanobdellota archaeon]